jgi:hypothetical protein
MSFLERLKACNHFDRKSVLPFLIDQKQVGWIKKAHYPFLKNKTEFFQLGSEQVHLTDQLDHYDKRTQALTKLVSDLRKEGILSDWHSELYPVAPAYGQQPLLAMERSVAPFFGIKTYGTHLNGYYEKDNQIWVWIARRASHLKFAPNKLDNMAAGGLTLGLSPQENMWKEATEEAQIPTQLLLNMRSTGTVSYLMDTPRGITPDTMFIFDLKLPSDFTPTTDGTEVSSFMTYSLTELAALVYDTDSFKYNSALVIIDFLIRHGSIFVNHPEYLEIMTAFRQPLVAEDISRRQS